MGPALKRNASKKWKEDGEVPELAAAAVPGEDAYAERASVGSVGRVTTGSEAVSGEDQFLCITVREARNLVAKDYETASSDPFAKITLGPHCKKSRVIYRNRHPMWQQRLLFPLESLGEGEPLLVEMWDKDFAGIEFLGQVIMTLGKALEIAQDPTTGRAYWFPLAKKRSTDIVAGHLCLGFEVLDAFAYAQVAPEVEAEMDPEAIVAALGGRALHVQLHGLNGLKANNLSLGAVNTAAGAAPSPRGPGGGAGKPKSWPRARSLYIRFGRFCLEKPLPAGFDEPGGEFEVAINEEVLIPLAPALRLGSLGARRKDELHDIKIYIKGTTHTIAKTQIPVWDVPIEDAGPSGGGLSPIADDGCGSDGGAPDAISATAALAAASAAAPGSPAATGAGGRATPPALTGAAASGQGGRFPSPRGAQSPAARPQSGRATPPLRANEEQPGSPSPRLDCASPPPAFSGPRCSWLGGPAAVAAAAATGAPASPATIGARSSSPQGLGPDCDPSCAALLFKKRPDDPASEPCSPRGATAGDNGSGGGGGGAGADSAAFSIPAHQPGDCASDDDAFGADGLVQRSSKSENASGGGGGGSAAAALAKAGPDSTLARPGAGAAKGAVGGPPAAGGPRRRAAAASYTSGAGSNDLSRRLRSMLAPGAREVSRMGWAPLRPTASAGDDPEPLPSVAATAAALGATPAAAASSGAALPVAVAVVAGASAAAVPATIAADALGGGWKGSGGKRYQRTLESHLALTAGNLEIAVTLRLVPLPSSTVAPEAVAIAAEGEARVLEDEDDDEDVPDAAPLVPPPALNIPVVDTPVNLGVNALYALMFGANTAFMAGFWASEDLRDVIVSSWGPPADPNPAVGCALALRSRKVSYVKPLRIPIPLAPKQCSVWEEQRLVSKGDGGWVVECKMINDAPKGDCFYVLVQLCGLHRASGQCQLRISMQMVFHRQCLGRGMIQAGAESDARRGWNALVATLQRHAAATSPAAALAAVPAHPALPPGVGGGAAADALVSPPGFEPRPGGGWLASLLAGPSARRPSASLVLRALTLLALLLLAAAVLHAGASVSRELRELTAAVRKSGCASGTRGG